MALESAKNRANQAKQQLQQARANYKTVTGQEHAGESAEALATKIAQEAKQKQEEMTRKVTAAQTKADEAAKAEKDALAGEIRQKTPMQRNSRRRLNKRLL